MNAKLFLVSNTLETETEGNFGLKTSGAPWTDFSAESVAIGQGEIVSN